MIDRIVARALFLPFILTAMVSVAEVKDATVKLPGVSLNGEWQQGGLLLGQAEEGYQVRFGDLLLSQGPQGQFLLGLGRNAPKSVSLTSISPFGEEVTQSYPIHQRDYQVQRVDGVPARTVNPPQEVLERIRRESAQVREARSRRDQRVDFLQGFVWPLKGTITGVYGSQRIYNGVPKSPHYGIDIAAPKGEIVRAPAPGVVSFAHDDLYYSGGTLIVDHGHGLSSTFIHLSESLVKDGQRVEAGDPIARVGSTGRSTGPHLDWRMNWLDVRIDPQLVLKALPAE
ncbi:M23 family metallopeptidase [Porticoccus sp. W117]|uniref:M23 family metallopeptidase n=1 Tax=Porticoccus sp. W117 TaxID=3054777 RepID=UPI0025993AD5|nr:M23 family metallopeptidase [Porticoccus sp. W117]MDM3870304.1 M23 family metallopeptidase [Porticoccus sp. W117]